MNTVKKINLPKEVIRKKRFHLISHPICKKNSTIKFRFQNFYCEKYSRRLEKERLTISKIFKILLNKCLKCQFFCGHNLKFLIAYFAFKIFKKKKI